MPVCNHDVGRDEPSRTDEIQISREPLNVDAADKRHNRLDEDTSVAEFRYELLRLVAIKGNIDRVDPVILDEQDRALFLDDGLIDDVDRQFGDAAYAFGADPRR